MNVCRQLRHMVQPTGAAPAGAVDFPKHVRSWLSRGGVKRGMFRQPGAQRIKHLLAAGDAVNSCPALVTIEDAARANSGRDNFFEFPSKIIYLVEHCHRDGLPFMARSVYANMLSKINCTRREIE